VIEVRRDGPVGTILLNRPEQLNALSGTMREDLLAAVAELGADPQVRVLIVTGAGRGFCAGGDLERLAELRQAGDAAGLQRLLELGGDVVLALRGCPKPVIASVNGPAAGAGLALALACDLRIAAASAVFSAAFVRIGLVPDWGATYLLPRLIGTAAALDVALSGRRIDAAEALRLGLVHRVAPDDALQQQTMAWAEELLAGPDLALGHIKQLIYRAEDAALTNQLVAEQQAQLQCFASPEVQSRLERRRAGR
jgi:2-(1,2-epoxy-1,2-dihydrophenyl)acetyl-CoA isomerase